MNKILVPLVFLAIAICVTSAAEEETAKSAAPPVKIEKVEAAGTPADGGERKSYGVFDWLGLGGHGGYGDYGSYGRRYGGREGNGDYGSRGRYEGYGGHGGYGGYGGYGGF